VPVREAPPLETGSIVIKGSKHDDGDAPPPPPARLDTDQARIDQLEASARASQGVHEGGKPVAAAPAPTPSKPTKPAPPAKPAVDNTITVFSEPAVRPFLEMPADTPRTILGQRVVKGARWIHVRFVQDAGWIHATKPKGPCLAARGDCPTGVRIFDTVSGQPYCVCDPSSLCEIIDCKKVNGVFWYNVLIGATGGWTTLVDP
jgi:hypothetical protein